jgi:hypothetical protein
MRRTVFLLTLFLAPALHAQTPQSCKDFLTNFYSRYIKTESNYDDEVRKHPDEFTPALRTSLLKEMRQESRGEVDGFESDPFLDAQDTVAPYQVDEARVNGLLCSATVHSGSAVHLTVELAYARGAWQFSDVVYKRGNVKERLTETLKKQAAH